MEFLSQPVQAPETEQLCSCRSLQKGLLHRWRFLAVPSVRHRVGETSASHGENTVSVRFHVSLAAFHGENTISVHFHVSLAAFHRENMVSVHFHVSLGLAVSFFTSGL